MCHNLSTLSFCVKEPVMGKRKARKKRKQRKSKKKHRCRDPNALGAKMKRAWRQRNQRREDEKKKCREKVSNEEVS
jgi:hypothetical protein